MAARIITDQISNRENPWSSLFSSGRMSEALKSMAEQTKSAIEHLVKFGKHCPHTGCTLSHNGDDNTFDCACHGSRFGAGQILWRPAVNNVKPD
jgi:Rieske Fe-S protein